MTLDEIRKLVAERREGLWAIPGAGTRARWESLCDATDALLAVIENLPTCYAEPPPGSKMADFDPPATATMVRPYGGMYCDAHAGPDASDLPYAAALLALIGKPRP